MSINLQVTITVKKTDQNGQPTGDPLYTSNSPITADTDGSINVTIPGQTKGWEVYVEAGQPDWLKFFAVSPATPCKQLKFVASDGCHSTDDFTLDQPKAFWGEALSQQLFRGTEGALTELQKLAFTNNDGCPADVTIYFVRNVSKRAPLDPCPKKST